MKIMVAVKRVADHNVSIRPNIDGSDVDLNNVKMAINPFCEIAVEAAVQLKEANIADEIVVVSIGPSKAQEQIRTALAMGADRGILIESSDTLEPLIIAKCLREIYLKEKPDLVLLGKQSIDGDNNQTGQMFAALADLPQATFASEIKIENNKAIVTREVDSGTESLELALPALITCDLRLNEPRFCSLPSIMKAKKKVVETIALSELKLDCQPRLRLLGTRSPPERKPGILVQSVEELLDKLKNEARVIL